MTNPNRPGLLVAMLCSTALTPSRSAGGRAWELQQTMEPAHVAIAGTDYAFMQPPSVLDAGPTLFSFENRGSKRHEMSIALLKPGVTTEVLTRRADRIACTARAVSDSLIGLLVARPGERSGGQLYANLISGRSYVVVCTLKDTPDAASHIDLGMIATFHVR